MQERRVLVTGGAGYIGSHVCRALSKSGFVPVAFDHIVSGHEWAVQWGPLIRGDLQNPETIAQALKEVQPVGVVHLAALHNVRESALLPAQYYTNNCLGTLALLKAMARTRVSHLIFSSSASVYGHPIYSPIDEEHPKNPISPYGRTKWFVEQMLADFGAAAPLYSVSLRYFNAAGAELEGEIGEAHDPETHLIPLTILAALKKRPPLTLFGEDHDTPDGTPIRDYVHVMDIAEAHVLALEWSLENKRSLTLNLGSGKGSSVKEVIAMSEKILKRPVPYTVSGRSSFDPPILVADPSLALEHLGWSPCLSDLQTIIESAASWHQKSVDRQSATSLIT